jgi:hypothetical protein
VGRFSPLLTVYNNVHQTSKMKTKVKKKKAWRKRARLGFFVVVFWFWGVFWFFVGALPG